VLTHPRLLSAVNLVHAVCIFCFYRLLDYEDCFLVWAMKLITRMHLSVVFGNLISENEVCKEFVRGP
jgi:hypothetical protein